MKIKLVLTVVVCLVCGPVLAQDSLNCREVGTWPFGPSYAVALDVQRGLAFMGSGGGVYVLNISNPNQPVKLSEIRTRGVVRDLVYNSNLLYIADGPAGLEIWDVANPSLPVKLGACNTPDDAQDVAVSGSYAYVADGSAGLRVIEFYGSGVEEKEITQNKEPVATVVCQVLKLPDESQSPELFDITGRNVLKLKPGLNDVRGIKPGVYFIKGEKTTKVLITR